MLHRPIQPAVGKSVRWRGIVALSMAAAGTVSFVIGILAGAFVMARKGEEILKTGGPGISSGFPLFFRFMDGGKICTN